MATWPPTGKTMTDTLPPEAGSPAGMSMANFLVSSVHDMKNSLAVMADYLETSLSQAPDKTSPLFQQTSHALYETQRINDHLIQLLALYKIDQEFYPFDPQEQNMADLALDAVGRVSYLAEARGVSLEFECDPDLLGWVDYELVLGVLVQAMHNALHYTTDQVLCLISPAPAGGVAIRVEDNGRGYPEFMLRQGNAINSGVNFESGSSGLGLYFSAVVAGLHRSGDRIGNTHLENGGRLGGGCFCLDLP